MNTSNPVCFLDVPVRPTLDLHQRMKISATILKSSVESALGSFSHLDLRGIRRADRP